MHLQWKMVKYTRICISIDKMSLSFRKLGWMNGMWMTAFWLEANKQLFLHNCSKNTDKTTPDVANLPRFQPACKFSGTLYIKCSKVSVRTYVRNSGSGQLSSEGHHNDNDVIMRTGAASAASAVGMRRHNENDVTMTIAGLWRYGDWRHVTTGCNCPVVLITDNC